MLSTQSKVWIGATATLVVAQAVVSLAMRPGFTLSAITDIEQCLLLLSGALAFLCNVMATRGRTRLFWALMMFGVALWLSYQMLWTYYEVCLRTDLPDIFVGDIVLFLHFVPMMAAFALQPHLERDERTLRLGSLDFTLLLVWWLYLYLFTVIPWQYVYPSETLYGQNLNQLYLIEKSAFLAGVALVWWRSRAPWRTVYAHWIAACAIYSLSSYLANWAIVRKVYYTGSIYDLPLAASMAWVTAVGLMALNLSPKQEKSLATRRPGVWVGRVSMITIFSLPLFAAWAWFDTSTPPRVRNFRIALTLCSMLIIGVMTILKQQMLDRELLGLLRASQESFENLRRLQAQLVQSEKLASLGQLVGGAAHELNNPLTAVLGYSELLAQTALSAEQRALTDKLGAQVQRTKTLISSLLSFGQQAPTEKVQLNLNVLVQTAVKLAQPKMQAGGVQIQTQLAREALPVLGDPNQLLQVCLHVIQNALNAMGGTSGVLTVNTRLEQNLIIVEFSDNGPGIEEPDRVFDPFYTTRPLGQGTGLGLSASYGIMREHNGKILCQNRPQGGAMFRLEFPVDMSGKGSSSPALTTATA